MVHDRQKMLAQVLTYAGTLPFLCAAAAVRFMPEFGDEIVRVMMAYGAIILSFLAGIHWAAYLFYAQDCPRNLFITSNVVALLAWAGLLVPAQPLVVLLYVLCFLYVLILDYKLWVRQVYPTWFYVLRRNATAIVLIALCLLVGVV